MYRLIPTVGYFSTSYELIKSQFTGTGSCFYKFYLLPEKNILPEQYALTYYKQVTGKQIDLESNKCHLSSSDYSFEDELYKITPYVGLKQRSFLVSVLSEVKQQVNSILVTGYVRDIDNTITELPFCQLILDRSYIVDECTVFDTEIKMFYPIPILLSDIPVVTDFPELFEKVITDKMYTFTCSSIFSSSFKIECFNNFDLFNYFVYSRNSQLHQCLQRTVNDRLTFTVNDLTGPILVPTVEYVEKFLSKFLRFTVRVPLDITTTVEKLKITDKPGFVRFKQLVVCGNYVNVGHDYITVDIEVNISKWLDYLTFMIRL